MKKVVIGIPVYNGSEYIYNALKSIQKQTFKDFLVLISDNCSTDNTKEICNEFVANDHRFLYTCQIKNIGATANFHHLLTQANAEYFMFLGHDDMISENFLEVCVDYLDSNPDTSITSGMPLYYDKNNLKYTGVSHNHSQNNAGSRLIEYYYRVKDNGIFYGLIRMEMVNHENFHETVGGDHFWIAEIIAKGKTKVHKNCHVQRQLGIASSQHGSSISTILIIRQANSYVSEVFLSMVKMLQVNMINLGSLISVMIIIIFRMYIKRLFGIKQFQLKNWLKKVFYE
jgi:glycosyltransferase involved in cell wall biosynthesis